MESRTPVSFYNGSSSYYFRTGCEYAEGFLF
ncbi:MAG TPA: hypothetical protein DE060_10385 [Lentisphaeria bacterium]|nr:hypothetical protein [Lentisphaeria bacterium]HCG49593.1 hypothetical protein [Lentisphaeria bacterium]